MKTGRNEAPIGKTAVEDDTGLQDPTVGSATSEVKEGQVDASKQRLMDQFDRVLLTGERHEDDIPFEELCVTLWPELFGETSDNDVPSDESTEAPITRQLHNRPPLPKVQKQDKPKDTTDSDFEHRFVSAAKNGREELVLALLEQGADVDSVDKLGGTALIRAAANGHLDIVEILLAHGADTEATTPAGLTALDKAVAKEWPSVARVLRNVGRDPDAWRSYQPDPANLMRDSIGSRYDWSSSLSSGFQRGNVEFGKAIITNHLPQEYLEIVAARGRREGVAEKSSRAPNINLASYPAVSDRGSASR